MTMMMATMTNRTTKTNRPFHLLLLQQQQQQKRNHHVCGGGCWIQQLLLKPSRRRLHHPPQRQCTMPLFARNASSSFSLFSSFSSSSSTTTTTTTTNHKNSNTQQDHSNIMDHSNASEKNRKTMLYDLHKEWGGKMVSFADYLLPVQYTESGGVKQEHLWTRSSASLFDVSHMGQIRLHGRDRAKFLETIVVGDIRSLKPNQSCLSLIVNDQGGIVDDTVITNHANLNHSKSSDENEYLYMVVNGATKFHDLEYIHAFIQTFTGDVWMESLGDAVQLLALQGPGAAAALSKHLPSHMIDLSRMPFMSSAYPVTIDGVPDCRITRCGYTGEDGFELSVPDTAAVSIASALLLHDDDPQMVRLAGLGARDSLRLEAGLCLYGTDMDATTTPVEASLGWCFGPKSSRRRTQQGFVGASSILEPDRSGAFKPVSRKRVGITGMTAPAREQTKIFSDAAGLHPLGVVTSGTFSPTLNKPIAMGYVSLPYSKVGTTVYLNIRGKMHEAKITKMPFVETKYYKPV